MFAIVYHGKEIPIRSGRFTIGRSPHCPITLDDSLISREHAVLVVEEEVARIEDLGSHNGVQVNGTPVRGQRLLSDGDVIEIGAQRLVVRGPFAKTPSSRHVRWRI